MEAYPFVEETAQILSNYWQTPQLDRTNLSNLPTIERIRNLVVSVMQSTPVDYVFLKAFSYMPDVRVLINEFSSRLKLLLYRDPSQVSNLEALTRDYRAFSQQSMALNVNIEWGDSTVSGSTAQVNQARKVQVDTIDLSKFQEP